jgi:hypothetical protein
VSLPAVEHTAESLHQARHGSRQAMLEELGAVLGVGDVQAVGVVYSRGPGAAWLVTVDGKPWRLPRATLHTAGSGPGSLDQWRRQVSANPLLPPLQDPRGAALSALHRLSQWAM